MRWNGSVLGKRGAFGRGIWSLRQHSILRLANDWPYSVSLPITTNLILHIDASRPETVTLNGNSVSAISDISTSAKTIDQTTAALQPEYFINARNGLNAIRFNAGEQHFLNLTSTAIPSSFTVFQVFSRPIASTFHSCSIGSTDREAFIWLGSASAGASNNIVFQWSNGSASTQHGTASTATGWFYMTSRRNGTTQMRIRRNGTTLADVTTGTGITNAASGNWAFWGRSFTNYHTGEIGELIVYDTNLSDADVDTVESYLATKWNI